MSVDCQEWDPKVVFSVVAVCVIFIVLSYYRILERILFPPRRHILRLPPNDRDNLDGVLTQLSSHRLALSIMQSLPTIQFMKGANDEEQPKQSSVVDCAICLGEFEDGEWLKHLPSCKHAFHSTCIDAWFQGQSNCPLCRSLVYDHGCPMTTCRDESLDSSPTMLQTLRREDFSRERERHHQIARTNTLQNLDVRTDVPAVVVVQLH